MQLDGRDVKTTPFSIQSLLNWGKLKENLKVYGRTGLVVYLGISFSITTSFYIALERNVDVKKLLGIKGEFHLHLHGSLSHHLMQTPIIQADDPNKEHSWIETVLIGKGSNLALAMLCSKLFVPIKLPAALALTPYVHRWQERMWRAWAKRGA